MKTQFLILTLAAGCASSGLQSAPPETAPQIFSGDCASCHAGSDTAATLAFDVRHADDFKLDVQGWLLSDAARVNHPGPKLAQAQIDALMAWTEEN